MERSATSALLRLVGVVGLIAACIIAFQFVLLDGIAIVLSAAVGAVALFAFAHVLELLEDIRDAVTKQAGIVKSDDPVRDEARAAVGLK